MSTNRKHGTWLLAATLWTLISGLPVIADDTELFVGDSGLFHADAQTNVFLILDTSTSMDAAVATQ